MRAHTRALSVALPVVCLVACGGAREERAAHPSAPQTAARLPHDRDLSVQTVAQAPGGPIAAEQVQAHPIQITLANLSADPIETWSVWVHATITHEGRPVENCTGEAHRLSDAPQALAPGESISVSLPFPCALEQPGTYEIVTRVDVGDPSAAGATALVVAEGSSAQQLVIEPR